MYVSDRQKEIRFMEGKKNHICGLTKSKATIYISLSVEILKLEWSTKNNLCKWKILQFAESRCNPVGRAHHLAGAPDCRRLFYPREGFAAARARIYISIKRNLQMTTRCLCSTWILLHYILEILHFHDWFSIHFCVKFFNWNLNENVYFSQNNETIIVYNGVVYGWRKIVE